MNYLNPQDHLFLDEVPLVSGVEGHLEFPEEGNPHDNHVVSHGVEFDENVDSILIICEQV